MEQSVCHMVSKGTFDTHIINIIYHKKGTSERSSFQIIHILLKHNNDELNIKIINLCFYNHMMWVSKVPFDTI